jgi:hypothetical protein
MRLDRYRIAVPPYAGCHLANAMKSPSRTTVMCMGVSLSLVNAWIFLDWATSSGHCDQRTGMQMLTNMSDKGKDSAFLLEARPRGSIRVLT